MEEFINWPTWLGTPSQVLTLAIIVITLIKTWPIIQVKVIEARLTREGRYGARISELEQSLKACHDECQERIDKLQTKLTNEARQRIQSEISLVHTLISVVDAPQLRTILAALERRRSLILSEGIEQLDGPISDVTNGGGDA